MKEQPFKKRKVGVLMGGLSREREISLKTGLSESAVKVTAHRGYKKMRQLMEGPTHGD